MESQMQDFRDALSDCNLMDMGSTGSWFTWQRGKFAHTLIREKLDIMVSIESWVNLFPNSKVSHLPFYHSDHCPLLLNTFGDFVGTSENDKGTKQFRFEATWITEDSVEQVIRSCWGSISDSIPNKLAFLASELTSWSNGVKFKKVEREKLLNEELHRLSELPHTDENLLEYIQINLELNLEIDRQEIYWEQRAHAHWLKEGDRNSSYFHKFATERKRRNRIMGIESRHGHWRESPNEIADIATEYFSNLYTSQGEVDCSTIMSKVVDLLPPDSNQILTQRYSREEIWAAVKYMDPLKASGADGFLAVFYQKYWKIDGDEVTRYCLSVKQGV